MNGTYIMLYIKVLFSQHILNKPLTKRESDKWMMPLPLLPFGIVEHLLRVYFVCYQHGYIPIQQFNEKRKMLQGIKLLSCDGIEPPYSLHRFIPALSIIVELVGGISKPVGGRREFPTLLQYLPDLVLLHFYLRVYQQKKKVVVAERECVRADTIHNVKYQLVHFNLQSVTVAADNLLQGFGMQQRGGKPHTAFFFCCHIPVLQMV